MQFEVAQYSDHVKSSSTANINLLQREAAHMAVYVGQPGILLSFHVSDCSGFAATVIICPGLAFELSQILVTLVPILAVRYM